MKRYIQRLIRKIVPHQEANNQITIKASTYRRRQDVRLHTNCGPTKGGQICPVSSVANVENNEIRLYKIKQYKI